MFLNKSKEDRATQVIANPNQFDVESVERKSLELGLKEGFKGEELKLFIYKRIGGAVAGEMLKADAKPGVISEETSGKEKEELPTPGSRRTRK